jgi:hypothetical protein
VGIRGQRRNDSGVLVAGFPIERIMVLLLYLWENLKKWSSSEEMRVGSGRKYEIENSGPGLNMNVGMNSGGMMGGSGGGPLNYEPKAYAGPGGGSQDYQQVRE